MESSKSLLTSAGLSVSLSTTLLFVIGGTLLLFVLVALYNLFLHPLAKYPGPWYAASTSLALAVISWRKTEPQWLLAVVRKNGTSTPIRIAPSMLLFPRPSSLKEIYWEPKLNTKSGLYGTGILGPPHLFTTLDGEEHRALRKALGGTAWSIGSLKKDWESRVDDQVQLFVDKMNERVKSHESFVLSDRVAEFAADIMTMLSFTNPWGFVANGRDERGILESWRQGLDFFGFVGRFTFFRNHVMRIPGLNTWFLPKVSDDSGMGYLMTEADRVVSRREFDAANGVKLPKPDFLQHCLEARIKGRPLSPLQKRAHATLLIQAGADTTGTSLGSTLRFIATHPEANALVVAEIKAADQEGKLSTPIQYQEAVDFLPYSAACIKESLRLNPPATNLFARVVGQEARQVDGHYVPAGTEITSNAFVVQRDLELYAPDPDSFRPERWLESKEKAQMLDAASFVFGIGPRICLGKDIALMELYKLIPEVIRHFDIDVAREGSYVVAGGVAYNENFEVRLIPREN